MDNKHIRGDTPRRCAAGFTLIELLIVVSILGILAVAALPTFTGFQKSQILKEAAKQVKSDLRFAQGRSLASVDGKAWGLNFSEGSGDYYIFSCPAGEVANYSYTYCSNPLNCADCKVKTGKLPTGITISAIGAPYPSVSDVFFDVLTGAVIINQSAAIDPFVVTISSGDGSGTVTVKQGGTIED